MPDWKDQMVSIGEARLTELRDIIKSRKADLDHLTKEYSELYDTLKKLGYKPGILEVVQTKDVIQNGAIFRFEIPTEHETVAWNLSQSTIDSILSDQVPDIFHLRTVIPLVAAEAGRSQNGAALGQAARGYMAYLLRSGKIVRGQKRGWYVKVKVQLVQDDKPLPPLKMTVEDGPLMPRPKEARGFGEQ